MESGFVESITSPIVKLFTSTETALKARKNALVQFLENRGNLSLIKDINKRYSTAKRLKDQVRYSLVDVVNVQTVVGMKTRLIHVAKMNNTHLKYISETYDDHMDKIDTRLAKFIGSEDVRKSFRKPTKELEDIQTFISNVKNDLEENFDSKDILDKKPLGKIIGNNNEYLENFEVIMNTNKSITDKFLIKMKENANKLTKRIDVIQKMIEENKIMVTKETLKGLIEAVDLLSNYITIISSLYYSHMKTMETLLSVHNVYLMYKNK
jgi:hypothetical protein